VFLDKFGLTVPDGLVPRKPLFPILLDKDGNGVRSRVAGTIVLSGSRDQDWYRPVRDVSIDVTGQLLYGLPLVHLRVFLRTN
jgi:hypothetical protein